MSEPTQDEMIRGVTALIPFVHRWSLPLNPEDLNELAYAVLLHARSGLPLEEIPAAVEHQIDEHRRAAQELYESMKAAADRRRVVPPC
ncbi:hypothetical protein JIG36_04070 [Actinoplanes sp. LDG1-06]|uniref:Uncharacterized protein n=1 Tax=Paractinoplanes ovalisporus TaxID=2810368 RepID=A0ABS2A4E7_9ACTN|nr:hypothetical protein [Actinoplanes ovalisporus]MBM2614730.1 hypothetical protein [Actinoplanes ovalisporus]